MRMINTGRVPVNQEQLVHCRNCDAEYAAKIFESKRVDFSANVMRVTYECPRCHHDSIVSEVQIDDEWFLHNTDTSERSSRVIDGTEARVEYINTQAR